MLAATGLRPIKVPAVPPLFPSKIKRKGKANILTPTSSNGEGWACERTPVSRPCSHQPGPGVGRMPRVRPARARIPRAPGSLIHLRPAGEGNVLDPEKLGGELVGQVGTSRCPGKMGAADGCTPGRQCQPRRPPRSAREEGRGRRRPRRRRARWRRPGGLKFFNVCHPGEGSSPRLGPAQLLQSFPQGTVFSPLPPDPGGAFWG